MGRRSPRTADAIIGRNISIQRRLLKVSQTELAQQLGVTYQQVQKYEKGTNRIGAGRVFRISQALKVPDQALFEGADATDIAGSTVPAYLTNAQAVRLAHAFSRTSDPRIRSTTTRFVEGLAKCFRISKGTNRQP